MIQTSLNLNSSTLMGKEECKKLTQLLNVLFEDKNSTEFRQPVDFKYLGLLDYPNIIANPMDLGTVRKNLRNNKYKMVEECLNDIQLIWDNCKKYNSEGSWIYDLALKLENVMTKNIQKNFEFLNLKKAINTLVDDQKEEDDC